MISIIITHYKEPLEWLRRAIESSLKQTCDKEIIVINDYGDDPAELVKEYPVKYIRHGENKRVSAARNTAITVAKGEWIVHLDSDDYFLTPSVLSQMLEHEKDADVLYANLITENGIKLIPNSEIKLDHWKGNNQIFSSSLYRKKSWEAIGGFWVRDIAFPEDYDFWGRLFIRGHRFVYVDLDLYYHTYRPDSEWEIMKPKFDIHRKEIIEHIWNSLS